MYALKRSPLPRTMLRSSSRLLAVTSAAPDASKWWRTMTSAHFFDTGLPATSNFGPHRTSGREALRVLLQRRGRAGNFIPVRQMVIAVELSEAQFHAMANGILDEIQDQLEAMEDDNPGLEVESSGDGVVNIKIAGKGHWVINKQTPSRQIWLSSPLTGPTHYKWEDEKWVCTKDGHKMDDRLSEQLDVKLP